MIPLVSKGITGLSANTTYHFRVVGVNSAGTTHGSDLTFTTLADTTSPSLNITSHSNGQHVTTSSITLSGTASDSGNGDNGIQQVTVNGVRAANDTATRSGTANWSKAVALNAGANSITVTAYDNSANHNATTLILTIYYDPAQAPSVTTGSATAVTPILQPLTGQSTPTDFQRPTILSGGRPRPMEMSPASIQPVAVGNVASFSPFNRTHPLHCLPLPACGSQQRGNHLWIGYDFIASCQGYALVDVAKRLKKFDLLNYHPQNPPGN